MFVSYSNSCLTNWFLGMTFGADGTTHRSINYNSRHVHYKAQSYSGDDTGTKQHSRLLGVHSSLDGTSEESVKSWKELLDGIAEIYNQSPLGKRTGHLLRVIDIFVKLTGMHSDHCAKEKKDFHLMEKEKTLATYQSLGEDEILERSNQELIPQFEMASKQMVQEAGGSANWDKLSDIEKAERQAKMMEKLVIELGKESFAMLSDDEKRALKLFIWAGCGCHKDLNTVRGGNAAMMAWWGANGVPPPVLLANRDNAAVLKDCLPDSDTVTPAQERALEKSTRGGVKATNLAGGIFNNKNDKKGHHDNFRWWWEEKYGKIFTFPDTSNNRFQSHCKAAAALIQHLSSFIMFLEYAKEKKQVMRFSNMEENLWKALHCTATKTELAALALYGLAISQPYTKYMRWAHAQNINMLDLGDYHKLVHGHIKRIARDPGLLLGPSATHETGSLDGKAWASPEAFAAIQNMAPELPHLKPVLVAFFKGASETWKRFTSEFTPGGLIDEATQEEKDLAFVPPTNDEEEGALGAFRILLRRQPQLSELQYNAQAMFHQNDTWAFMEKMFHPDDYEFVWRVAREADSQKLEPKRRKGIVQHNQARNNKRRAGQEMRRRNAVQKANRIAAVKVIENQEEVKDLKGQQLRDCLAAYKQWGAPIPASVTTASRVGPIREAIRAAIASYNAGEWRIEGISEAELVNEEDLDSEEDDSSWEDD